MSKLFLLISLMGFISIEVFADPSKKTSGSTLGKNWANQSTVTVPKPTSQVRIPCQAGVNCLDNKKSQNKTISTAGLKGEAKVKADCHNKSGGYGDAYQKCLSDNGVFHVQRNINNVDNSQSDARICFVGDPLCDKCLAQSKGAKNNAERRNKVASCIAQEKQKQRTVAQEPAKPKPKPKPNEKETTKPQVASTRNANRGTEALCKAQDGDWNDIGQCWCLMGDDKKILPYDDSAHQYITNCARIKRFTAKCESSPDTGGVGGIFYSRDSVNNQGACVCPNQTEFVADDTFFGQNKCGDETTAKSNAVADCIAELQEKVNSCGSSATNAVNKCNPDQESNGSDTISTLQTLLGGATSAMQASGAAKNCSMAAVAGTTGYYALEELRDKCDNDISSCKSSCGDASTYISNNKQRVYEACREQQYKTLACTVNDPFSNRFVTEQDWKAEWDKVNKGPFEQQIAQMESSIASSNEKCEQNGKAVSNREKMSNYMGDMDSAFKSASQCECQLGAGGGDCANQVGPAACSANPSLAGCAKAKINCLSATDNSPQCLCFKNPTSDECKGVRNVATAVRSLSPEVSGFAGGGGSSVIGGSNTGASVDTKPFNAGDLSGLGGGHGEAAGAGSGTATVDSGSPFASAGGPGGGGGSSNGGNSAGNANASGSSEDGENGAGSKLRGLFNVAKGAIGSLFNGKNNGSDKSYTGADGVQRDANGNPIDPKKWRPRGMVRGLAGNDTEIGGKFEDIWKVMNKQYKVQDQKDSFIFGEKN